MANIADSLYFPELSAGTNYALGVLARVALFALKCFGYLLAFGVVVLFIFVTVNLIGCSLILGPFATVAYWCALLIGSLSHSYVPVLRDFVPLPLFFEEKLQEYLPALDPIQFYIGNIWIAWTVGWLSLLYTSKSVRANSLEFLDYCWRGLCIFCDSCLRQEVVVRGRQIG